MLIFIGKKLEEVTSLKWGVATPYMKLFAVFEHYPFGNYNIASLTSIVCNSLIIIDNGFEAFLKLKHDKYFYIWEHFVLRDTKLFFNNIKEKFHLGRFHRHF